LRGFCRPRVYHPHTVDVFIAAFVGVTVNDAVKVISSELAQCGIEVAVGYTQPAVIDLYLPGHFVNGQVIDIGQVLEGFCRRIHVSDRKLDRPAGFKQTLEVSRTGYVPGMDD